MTTILPTPDGREGLDSEQHGATSNQAANTEKLPEGRTWTHQQILFALSEILDNRKGYNSVNGPSSVADKPEMGIKPAPYERKKETPGAWMQ